MYHRLSKSVVGGASLAWAIFMVYLLTHIQIFGNTSKHLKASYQNEFPNNHSNVDNNVIEVLESNSKNSHLKVGDEVTDVINIIIQANEDNIGGLISAVNSIIMNTKSSVHFYFVIPQESTSHIQEWLVVSELSSVKYSLATLPTNLDEYSNAAKFWFPVLFPVLNGRAIYLDPDVIVQGDIAELVRTQILPNDLGAFSDDCHSGSASKIGMTSRGDTRYATRLNLNHLNIAKLDINPLTCTFSTGVFVIANVDTWRSELIHNQVQDLIRSHESSPIIGIHGGTDVVEAAMLVVLYRRTSPIDPLWHVRNLGVPRSPRYSPFFISNAKLLHWNGHLKPWKSSRSYTFEQKLWDKYFIRDPLARFIPIRKKPTEI